MANFKDKYVCNGCGKRFTKKVGKCIACGSFDIDELPDDVGNMGSGMKGSGNSYTSVRVQFHKVKDAVNAGRELRVVKNFPNFPSLNDIVSAQGGLLESQVVLVGASPGTGKSTLCTQIADANTLFISSEETLQQVSGRFKRCNGDPDALLLESVNDMEILSAIAQTECDTVILDSLNSIENDSGGIASYAKVADIAQRITHLVKGSGKAIIIVSQVTKGNNIVGMESIVHAVDTVIHMERCSTSDKIVLMSSKNRFAEVGEIMFLRHCDCGLEEVPNECGFENSPGTTVFKMVSGSKKIPMEVQALIVSTDDKPVRRAVGISFNKLSVIDAILRSNEPSYDTKYSDIYMSTSNGLLLPEGNDVVIANSLLSAYYNTVLNGDLDDFGGNLNLNGTIGGNKKYKHISDLINAHKRERG